MVFFSVAGECLDVQLELKSLGAYPQCPPAGMLALAKDWGGVCSSDSG